jgi:predicted peptidase
VAAAAGLLSALACDTPAPPNPPDPPSAPPPAVNFHPDETGFMPRAFVSRGGLTLPYRLYVPKSYQRGRQYPMVIWLHGAGGTGSDNVQQIGGDQVPGTRLWIQPDQERVRPTLVVVPQSDNGWDTSEPASSLHPSSAAVLELIELISGEFSVDVKRIYLLGQSAGGRGVWNLITLAPEKFAASILVCPVSIDVEPVTRAASVPLWAFQGSEDSLLKETKDRITELQRAGAHVKLTEYKGAGHDIWTRVFQERGLAEWLFSHRRQ